jgi:hypothetical protein
MSYAHFACTNIDNWCECFSDIKVQVCIKSQWDDDECTSLIRIKNIYLHQYLCVCVCECVSFHRKVIFIINRKFVKFPLFKKLFQLNIACIRNKKKFNNNNNLQSLNNEWLATILKA